MSVHQVSSQSTPGRYAFLYRHSAESCDAWFSVSIPCDIANCGDSAGIFLAGLFYFFAGALASAIMFVPAVVVAPGRTLLRFFPTYSAKNKSAVAMNDGALP